MEHIDKILNQLVEKLRDAHGKRLRSVILYGSGATGEIHGAHSDLNVFCVLDGVTPKDLGAAESVFQWWREKGNPAPLLLSSDEVRTSTDCFPIEFHDIVERHKVLYGDDVTHTLKIDDRFYRAQVEHELRAKQLRLRQKAAGVLSAKELLLRLMTDSVSTFCVLGRHALRLGGFDAPWTKSAIVASLRESFAVEGRAFDTLLSLRQGTTRPSDIVPLELFQMYLDDIAALVAAVDKLDS
ncbi:MAG: hypothetical protein IPP47_28885 [Bryobacterales bacterium]|nr:hypothetical protein [Bryobacterales bacterium]